MSLNTKQEKTLYLTVNIERRHNNFYDKQSKGSRRDLMAKALGCCFEISEFEPQLFYYVHLWSNAPWESYELHNPRPID